MLKKRYARWMYEWETRLTTRDENRVVRPLEWGFEWLAPFLESNGFCHAIPEPEVLRDPLAAEAAMVAINQLLIRHSDRFFGYERPADFRLEERHPQLYPTNVRPETLALDAAMKDQAAKGALAKAQYLRFTSPERSPYPENDLVNARWFPAPAHKDPKRPKQAIVVLPQWNSDGLGHNTLCSLFNRMGVSALRLSMPYHDIRRPAELERSDYSVSANIGRTIAACRQAVVDIRCCIDWLEEQGLGARRVQYKLRDWLFSRQRYWGEPFPITWKDGIAAPLDESQLPLELPHVEKYGPGPEGEGPLANVAAWTGRHLETNTMPGYAGSSWYFLRYMDPHNDKEFCSRAASDYWGQVDLYIGGTEHAVGHLLYSRMWTKFLYDRGWIGHEEPYKRLVNQGMIQGSSRLVYRVELNPKPSDNPIFISYGIAAMEGTPEYHQLISLAVREIFNDPAIELESITLSPLHVDVNIVDGVELDLEAFKHWRSEYAHAEFILEDGKYICGTEVEKMSKRLYNTVNPNDLVKRYGADTYRMYEMFLGPVEQSKPWDTKGIEGVHRFLRKLWRLFYDEIKGQVWTTAPASEEEWKCIYRTIKKTGDATERFSFNTGVSALMIGVNELIDLKCHKKEILEKLVVILTPYAPHVSEELWRLLGHESSVLDAPYPKVEEKYLVESAKNYPIAINGKTRTELTIDLDATQQQVEDIVLADDTVKKWLEGKPPKKVVYVKNRMINVVV